MTDMMKLVFLIMFFNSFLIISEEFLEWGLFLFHLLDNMHDS